jgi:hypothetical protein
MKKVLKKVLILTITIFFDFGMLCGIICIWTWYMHRIANLTWTLWPVIGFSTFCAVFISAVCVLVILVSAINAYDYIEIIE